jgi:hypothetical protein
MAEEGAKPAYEPGSFDDVSERFNQLAREAESYGIDSALVVHQNDMLDRTFASIGSNGAIRANFGYRGSFLLAAGMLQWAAGRLMKEYGEPHA